MRINLRKISVLLTIALAIFVISFNSAHADGGTTRWGQVTQIKVGDWNTYVWFNGCNCGNYVRLSPDLADYEHILSSVLTAMALNLQVQFYSPELSENKCFVTRVHIRK